MTMSSIELFQKGKYFFFVHLVAAELHAFMVWRKGQTAIARKEYIVERVSH